MSVILLVGCGRFTSTDATPKPAGPSGDLRVEVDLGADGTQPLLALLQAAFGGLTVSSPASPSGPVDLVFGVGAAFEARADSFAPLPPALLASLPSEVRDEGSRFAALDRRAWVLTVGRLMANAPTGLLDVAEPRFKGRFARPTVDDGLDVVFATALADRGAPVTQRLLEGIATNEPVALAPPEALAALVDKRVELAITDHLAARAHALAATDKRSAAAIEQAVSEAPFVTVYPDADATGVPWSAALIGRPKDAPNPGAADAVLAWLLSPAGQTAWSAATGGYPVHPEARPAAGLRSPDTFRWSQTSLAEQAELRAQVRAFLANAGID